MMASTLLWIAWAVLALISGVVTMLMFAFADSPDAGRAAERLIKPAMIAGLMTFACSGGLLFHASAWSIPLAFALLALPPLLVILGYKVLL